MPLSFELVRPLPFVRSVSATSAAVWSSDCNRWEDLEAIRLEKNDREASRPCLGDALGGEGGYCGIAVIFGETSPLFPVLALPALSVLF
jgi:hypothetical protein